VSLWFVTSFDCIKAFSDVVWLERNISDENPLRMSAKNASATSPKNRKKENAHPKHLLFLYLPL